MTAELELDTPKTKILVAKLDELGLDRRADRDRSLDENLYLAARNLPTWTCAVGEPRPGLAGRLPEGAGRPSARSRRSRSGWHEREDAEQGPPAQRSCSRRACPKRPRASAGRATSTSSKCARMRPSPRSSAAVEQMFDVKVEKVNVVNVKGKNKRFGRTPGRRSDWRKAYVRLAEGQSIDCRARAA